MIGFAILVELFWMYKKVDAGRSLAIFYNSLAVGL